MELDRTRLKEIRGMKISLPSQWRLHLKACVSVCVGGEGDIYRQY